MKQSPSSALEQRVRCFRPLAAWAIYPPPCPCRRVRKHRRRCWRGCGAMTADRAIYLDSSAIVKLAVAEKESTALRRYLRRRAPLVVSALTRTEVAWALLPLGPIAVQRGHEVLSSLDLSRVSHRILPEAESLSSTDFRSLDGIHLAPMKQFRVAVPR